LPKITTETAIKNYNNWKIDKGVSGYYKLYNGFAKAAVEKKLSKSEALVYLLLCECAQNDTGLVIRTSEKLSEMSGMPKQTIDNSLKKLEDKDLIHRETNRSKEGYSTRKIVVRPYTD
jgi:DNA-binding MarR family transcriptional regulator